MNQLRLISLLGLSLLNLTYAYATGDASLQGPTKAPTLRTKAKRWGLTVKEYRRYRQQIQQGPSKRWWQNLDPPHVLGLNAKTQAKRRHYARIDAKLDHERAQKELAFQRAYSQAYATLYPNAHPIEAAANKANWLQAGDRFYLFMHLGDTKGTRLTAQLLQKMRHQHAVALNLFFVGQASNQAIQRWAKASHLPKALPNGNKLTLNHNRKGKNSLLHRLLKDKTPTLPVLIRVRAGQSQQVKWAS